MLAIKKTTGLTGLAVSKSPHVSLKALYNSTLKLLQAFPADAPYRKHTEVVVQSRLKAVHMEPDVAKLEGIINAGQIEEVISQANREYDLVKLLLRQKAWEPLVEEAPKNQWKWPI